MGNYQKARWMVSALAVIALLEFWGAMTAIIVSNGLSPIWPLIVASLLVSGGLLAGARHVTRILLRAERDARGAALRIHARTAALGIARGLAERKLMEQTRFLASMSHELRTPLNAIIGFSEALASGVFGPLATRHADYVRDIHHSGLHLQALVDDLLDIAALDADRGVLVETEIDLAELIDEAAHMVASKAAAAGVSLEPPPSRPAIRLTGDYRRLLQILLNIISNAVKYTRQGGKVMLSVETHQEGACSINISDNGIGMLPEEVKVALAPFGRASNKETCGIEGTGLGLPLAIRLIEIHGGALTIDSMRGIGTTVSITVPASRVRAS